MRLTKIQSNVLGLMNDGFVLSRTWNDCSLKNWDMKASNDYNLNHNTVCVSSKTVDSLYVRGFIQLESIHGSSRIYKVTS